VGFCQIIQYLVLKYLFYWFYLHYYFFCLKNDSPLHPHHNPHSDFSLFSQMVNPSAEIQRQSMKSLILKMKSMKLPSLNDIFIFIFIGSGVFAGSTLLIDAIGTKLPGNEYVCVEHEDFVDLVDDYVYLNDKSIKTVRVEFYDDYIMVYTKMNLLKKYTIPLGVLICMVVMIWLYRVSKSTDVSLYSRS